jgi:hypothetical protein
MRLLALIVALMPCLAAFAADAPSPTYTLHEWGVFTVPRGNQYSQQDLKREWQSFPDFFHCDSAVGKPDRVPDEDLVRVKKPVVWLYADQPMTAALTVGFPQGRPMVWWPQASLAMADGSPSLSFTVSLQQKKPIHVQGHPVAASHWLARLRQVPGDWLWCDVPDAAGKSEKIIASPEGDSLIYYDGLVPALPEPIVTALTDGTYEVRFPDGGLVLDALLVERRDGGVQSVSEWIDSSITPATGPEKNEFSVRARLVRCDEHLMAKRMYELFERLQAAGLTRDEAAALLAVWEPQLFGADGLTIFYRMPQPRYERLLPLTAVPKPTATVRVGLVVHTHMEPDLQDRVTAQIALLSDPATRTKALAQLAELGGAAFTGLREAARSAAPEVAKLCRELLAAEDLSPAMTADR